jgi:hypothetical protein
VLWESIEEDLLRLIRAGSFGAIPRERLDTIEDLVTHVEYGVALELLCSNLDDFEVEVDPRWALALEFAVDRLGLDSHYRALVRGLRIRDANDAAPLADGALSVGGLTIGRHTVREEVLEAFPSAKTVVANGEWSTLSLGEREIRGARFVLSLTFRMETLQSLSLFHTEPDDLADFGTSPEREARREQFHRRWLGWGVGPSTSRESGWGSVETVTHAQNGWNEIVVRYRPG